MLRYKYAGIREKKIQMSRDDRHMSRVMRTSIGTVIRVSIKFVEKGTNKPKRGYEYRTEHKTRTGRNTGRTTGRQENMHTRHRLIETGKQTRNVREGDRGYHW